MPVLLVTLLPIFSVNPWFLGTDAFMPVVIHALFHACPFKERRKEARFQGVFAGQPLSRIGPFSGSFLAR